MKTQEQFIVSHQEQKLGPFTKNEIVQRLKNGEFSVIDFVYVEEKNDWVTLLEFVPDARPQAKPKASVQPAKPKPPIPHPAKLAQAKALSAAVPAQSPLPLPGASMAQRIVETAASTSSIIEMTPPTDPHPGVTQAPATPLDQLILKNGVGSIDLLQFKAGKVKVSVKSLSANSLETPEALPLIVKPAKAVLISLKGPSEFVAGTESCFELEAVDQFGNCDTSYSGSFTVSVLGAVESEGTVQLVNGRARFPVTISTAGKITLKLLDHQKTGLQMDSEQSAVIHPGAPARYVLVAPEEAIAGQASEILVKVVDAFGNHVTNFDGKVQIEVDAPEIAIQKVSVAS